MGSGREKGVFDDLILPGTIDQRDIKADVGHHAVWFRCQKLFRRTADPLHLTGTQMFGSLGKVTAFLDFDKHQPVVMTCHQIDFTREPAPSSFCDLKSAPLIVLRDLQFSRLARKMGHLPT